MCCKGERRQWRIQRTEAGAAVAECEGLLLPKHDADTATRHWRAFWQRRCRAAAVGAVLKPSGGNCEVLPLIKFLPPQSEPSLWGGFLCIDLNREHSLLYRSCPYRAFAPFVNFFLRFQKRFLSPSAVLKSILAAKLINCFQNARICS